MARIALVLALVLLVSAALVACGIPPTEADFVAEPTRGEGITVVQFSDQSTGEIISWAWDFNGDGTIDSTEQNPAYTYRRDGLYSVTLTIVGLSCEDTLTKTNYIQITGCHP